MRDVYFKQWTLVLVLLALDLWAHTRSKIINLTLVIFCFFSMDWYSTRNLFEFIRCLEIKD